MIFSVLFTNPLKRLGIFVKPEGQVLESGCQLDQQTFQSAACQPLNKVVLEQHC